MLISQNKVFGVGTSCIKCTLESISGPNLINKTFLEKVGNCLETVFWVFLNYSYKEKYCDSNLQILGKNIENRVPILNLKYTQNKKP